MIPRALEALATFLVLVGVWLIGVLDIRGQYIMLASQALWFAWAVMGKHRWLAAQSVILAGLSVKAIITWRAALEVLP